MSVAEYLNLPRSWADLFQWNMHYYCFCPFILWSPDISICLQALTLGASAIPLRVCPIGLERLAHKCPLYSVPLAHHFDKLIGLVKLANLVNLAGFLQLLGGGWYVKDVFHSVQFLTFGGCCGAPCLPLQYTNINQYESSFLYTKCN